MCFYSEYLNRGNVNLITLDEIEKISKSLPGLFHLILTGGEPFLRSDIGEIAGVFYKNSETKNISIPTNGFFTDLIITHTKKIIENNAGLNLRVIVSLDGFEEVHNYIRGNDLSFRNSIDTIKKLKNLEKDYPNFTCGVCTTLSSYNKNYLQDFIDFVINDISPSDFDILLSRGKTKEEAAVNVTAGEYKAISDYLEKRTGLSPVGLLFNNPVRFLEMAIRKVVYKTLKEKIWQFPCLAGKKMAVVFEDGLVMPCEMIGRDKRQKQLLGKDFFFGNIRDTGGDLPGLLNTMKAEGIRGFIKKEKCFCSFECALAASIFFSPKQALRVLLQSLLQSL